MASLGAQSRRRLLGDGEPDLGLRPVILGERAPGTLGLRAALEGSDDPFSALNDSLTVAGGILAADDPET
jgi:hypothetical protein